MRPRDFNWREHANDSWAGTPEYEVLPEEPDLPVLRPSDARQIYESANRSRAAYKKRRWILDHSFTLFSERRPWVRGAVVSAVAIAILSAVVALSLWWLRPDPARANQRLTEAVAEYDVARASFGSGSPGCAGLVDAYGSADRAFVRAAETFVKLGVAADPAQRASYERLIGRIDGINRHFDASGCPRP